MNDQIKQNKRLIFAWRLAIYSLITTTSYVIVLKNVLKVYNIYGLEMPW